MLRLNAEDASGARHQETRPGEDLQRPRRSDLRGTADATPAARRLPRLRILGGLRADGRARQIGRPRRLSQPSHPAQDADQDHALARRRQSIVQVELWDGRIEHMSETFAAMENDAAIKRTLREARSCAGEVGLSLPPRLRGRSARGGCR